MPFSTLNFRRETGSGQCNTRVKARNPSDRRSGFHFHLLGRRLAPRADLEVCPTLAIHKEKCWGARLGRFALAALALLPQMLVAETNSFALVNEAAALARETHRAAVERMQREPGSADAALEAGKACFEFAEFATRKADRAALADQGIEACRLALALRPDSAPAYYYLGMNMGQMARTKGWAALRMVGQLQKAFERASELDPKVDFAGPHRNLGYLFRDTPSFGSIGDRDKARQHLRRALELVPDYPENRLAWIEGLAKWGERKQARSELEVLEKEWTVARGRFSTAFWAPNWVDWENRLREVRRRIEEHKKFLGIFGSSQE